MADFEKFSSLEDDMDIIQKLGDSPNADNDLSPDELKAEFDKGGNLLKKFINNMVAQLNGLVDTLNNSQGDKLFAGGTMIGPLNMNNQRLSGLTSPTSSDQAANKGYVDSKHYADVSTLTAAGWVGSSPPYSQAVSISGILQSDMPHIGPVYSDNAETALAEKEAWPLVSSGIASDGMITFRCFEDKPEVDIAIQVEVNR